MRELQLADGVHREVIFRAPGHGKDLADGEGGDVKKRW